DVIEVLHGAAATAQPLGVVLDPGEDLVLVQQLLIRLDLGAGQQAAGIEVAGQLVVEPPDGQVPLLAVARSHRDVCLATPDGPELAPVALLPGVALADLRRGNAVRPGRRPGARSPAAAVGDGAHQALPLD